MSTFFCDVLFLLLLSLSKHCFQDSNEISAYTRSQTRATAGRHINSFIARPTSDAQLFQLRVRETTSKHARLSRIERIRKQILFPIVHLPFSLSLSLSPSRERKRDLISISLSLSLSPPSLLGQNENRGGPRPMALRAMLETSRVRVCGNWTIQCCREKEKTRWNLDESCSLGPLCVIFAYLGPWNWGVEGDLDSGMWFRLNFVSVDRQTEEVGKGG